MSTTRTRASRGADENRARLLNLAAGGSGHLSAYLERVTLEGAEPERATAYVYHNPPRREASGRTSRAEVYLGPRETCEKFYLLPYLEASEDERREAAAAMVVEDTGRVIPRETWAQLWDTLRVLPTGRA